MMTASMLGTVSPIVCPHGGRLVSVNGSTRVHVAGAPVLTIAASFVVDGCASTSTPCLTAYAYGGSERVKVNGLPVLTSASTGMCLTASGAPNGPFTPGYTSSRVEVR